MRTTSKLKMPSVTELLAGECPKEYLENMKIILSRTTTSHALGELFILVDRIGFVLVRLMDIDYIAGDIHLTVINQETGLSHVISHSLIDDVPEFTLVKLYDVLRLSLAIRET